MPVLSYMDNIFKLSHCFIKRDYSSIREEILSMKEELNFRYEEDGEIWGYQITRNMPVSGLYGFHAYVVRFYFTQIDTLHNAHQEEIMEKVFLALRHEIEMCPGYYNLRLPAHVVDVLKAFNRYMPGCIFCGGTVEQAVGGKEVDIPKREGIRVFFAERDYLKDHREQLLEMTYSSFASYQGQYHISSVTDEKAGLIYEKWIESYFENFEDNRIFVVEYHGEPVGFCTIGEDEHVVEGQLSAISSSHRKLGAYRTLISSLINYAYKNGKSFTASTQFDNYIVQGTWNSLGMKPYFSFYNFHFDNRQGAAEAGARP